MGSAEAVREPMVGTRVRHNRVMRTIPKACRAQWIELCKVPLIRFIAARAQHNEEAKRRALRHFLSLPSLCLGKMRGGRKRKGRRAAGLNERMGEVRAYMARDATAELVPPQDLDRDLRRQEVDYFTRKARQANRLVEEGFKAKAMQALLQDQLPRDVTQEEVMQTLLGKFPQQPEGSMDVPVRPHTEDVIIQPDEAFKRSLRKMANGSAAGPSGMTGMVLAVLAGDQDCCRALALIMQDMRNGAFDDEARELLMAARLIPAPKGDDDIRPIGILEVIYRWTATVAVASVAEPAAQRMQPEQMAIGVKGGIEIAGTDVVSSLINPQVRYFGFKGDLNTAYTSRPRSAMLSALYQAQDLQSIWKFSEWAYSKITKMQVDDGNVVVEVIAQSCGAIQGDPLSALLFSLSMDAVYKYAVAEHQDTVKAKAVIDDYTLVAQQEDVGDLAVCVFRFINKCAEEGIVLNMDKSCLLWLWEWGELQQEQQDCLQRLMDDAGLGMRNESFILGIPVASTADRMVEMLRDKVQDTYDRVFEVLGNEHLRPQYAYLLLKHCGVTRPMYSTRLLPPTLPMKQFLAEFDGRVMAAAQHIFDVDVSNPVVAQLLTQPTRLNGAGIISYALIGPFAFLASMAQALPHLSVGQLPQVYTQGMSEAIELAREYGVRADQEPHTSSPRKRTTLQCRTSTPTTTFTSCNTSCWTECMSPGTMPCLPKPRQWTGRACSAPVPTTHRRYSRRYLQRTLSR